MRTSRILALAAAAFLIVAPAARAQQPSQKSQKFLPSTISLSGGIYAPEGTDLDENDADTGLAVFLNTGYMTRPFWGLQFDLGYFETSGGNGLQVSAFPAVHSLKLALPISFIEPYVLGGAGVYFTQAELKAPGLSVDDSSIEFAPHAAGGLNLNFGNFQIGAEARYVWLDASGLDVDGWMITGKVGTRY
jgi:hypothetical protein